METLEPAAAPADLNSDIAAMVGEIAVVGPRVPEIARRLGRHKETVRYWYKKLEDSEFAIQAILNHEALGLRRVVLKVRFGAQYTDYISPLMFAMNEQCYVTSYAKALPEDVYLIHASVPAERVDEYLRFVEALRDQGVFLAVDWYHFDWFRNRPMRADSYDFETGHWDLDMPSLLRAEASPFSEPTVSARVKFDRLDLLIAKELQSDATREMQEVQRAIKERDGLDVNYKTMCWHLGEHVEANGLIKGFRINWMGSRWDPVVDRARHRSHTYVVVYVLVKGPTPEERHGILRMLDRLPVVWAEAGGEDCYAEIAFPSEMLMDGLKFLNAVMAKVHEKVDYHIMDQRSAIGFTFSYQLYDEETRAWIFNAEELLVKFKALEAQIRNV